MFYGLVILGTFGYVNRKRFLLLYDLLDFHNYLLRYLVSLLDEKMKTPLKKNIF